LVYDLSNGRAPRWLHEGLAQEAERIAEAPLLRQAQDERQPDPHLREDGSSSLPPLRQLLGIAEEPGRPSTSSGRMEMTVGQFYSASHQLIRFLLEAKGWDRMRVYLKGLGQGQSVEEATQAVYGWTLTALEKKWRSRLKNH